jgi:lysophospholipase L1-like esterase
MMARMSRIITLTAALVALAVALPGAASAAPRLYVNLGDSYATGYQRNGPANAGRSTRQGYADQLVPRLQARGYGRLRLVNFGCGGATTGSLNTQGCAPRARAVGGASYGGRSQLAAAERFLRRNRGDVALVTISIGGNDVTRCATQGDQAVPCVVAATGAIRRNLTVTLRRLRAAAGRRVPIVGLTYPNVILGEHVLGNPALAELSIVAFRDVINPTLRELYGQVGGRFVDVTRGFAGETPFTVTTPLPPYGTVPVAVARICTLSYYCQLRDIHLRTAGYREMARLIAAALPRRR